MSNRFVWFGRPDESDRYNRSDRSDEHVGLNWPNKPSRLGITETVHGSNGTIKSNNNLKTAGPEKSTLMKQVVMIKGIHWP